MTSPGGGFIYARSTEVGEIWPAIFEKAFAKWVTYQKLKKRTDHPNYANINKGSGTDALSQLTGLKNTFYSTKSLSANEIYTKVEENCVSRKTFNPMIADTYGSADAAPDKIKYDNANIVATHTYSILGMQQTGGNKYIVLRNPWGSNDPTLAVVGGTWTAWDAPYNGGPGWWRPIDLATTDGIFALQADTFKKYFSGFGVAKET